MICASRHVIDPMVLSKNFTAPPRPQILHGTLGVGAGVGTTLGCGAAVGVGGGGGGGAVPPTHPHWSLEAANDWNTKHSSIVNAEFRASASTC